MAADGEYGGKVYVDIEPNASGFADKLGKQVTPKAKALGQQIARDLATRISDGITRGIGGGMRDAPTRARGGGRGSGEAFGSEFDRIVRTKIQAALRSLPKAQIGVATTEAEQKLRDLRVDLERMSGQRIGVDIDPSSALAEVARIDTELKALAASSADVQVRVDVASASVALATITTEINRLDGRSIKVGVDPTTARASGARSAQDFAGEFDRTVRTRVAASLKSLPPAQIGVATDAAQQKLFDLRTQLQALSDRRVGVDIDPGVALGEIERIRRALVELRASSADVQVRADVGQAAIHLTAIREQVRALSGTDVHLNVDVDSAGATGQMLAMHAATMASQAGLGMLGAAGASMGSIIVPAAAAAVAGIGAIGPAAIGGAMGLGVMVLALSGVVGAVKALDQAQTKSVGSSAASASRASSAAAAADQLRSAESSLTTAQERATKAQLDLVAAREAEKRAQEDLAAQIRDNSLDQREASLKLQDAQATLTGLGNLPTNNRARIEAQLAYDKAKAQSDDLAVQAQRLGDEQAHASQVGVEGSDRVVAAQQAVVDAGRQVEASQRQIAAAHRAAATAAVAGGGAAATAAQGVAAAMAPLSPAGRDFAQFIMGLKPVFMEIRRVAETAFLPGLKAGIMALEPLLPTISRSVGLLGGALGTLAASVGASLASPFWQAFIEQMTQLGVVVINLAGPILMNLATAFAGILLAFAPLVPRIGAFLVDLTARFAAFATGLSANPAFQRFIDYVVANAPMLLSVLADLGIVFVKLMIAIAPYGAIMLKAMAATLAWVASLNPGQIAAIVGVVGAVVAAIGAAVSSTVLMVAAVVAAVVGIVAGIMYAWNHCEAFRTAVTAMWQGIVAVATWAWTTVIRPVLEALGAFFTTTLAPALTYFWQAIVVPVWQGITLAFGVAWSIIKPILDGIWFVIQNVLAPLFMFLWQGVVVPVWQGIMGVISFSWAVIQVVFGLVQIGVKILAAVFVWLWQNVISPVWNLIRPVFVALGGIIRDYVVPAFRAGVEALGKAWESIRDIAKIPVRFVIETILNNGLLAGYNRLAKLFGVKPDNVQIPLPGFATGGLVTGPGTGTSDSILAQVIGGPTIRVSNGEYIIPAGVVRAYGVDFFDGLSGRSSKPGDGSQGLAFAGGGILDFAGGLWDAATHPEDTIRKPINALIGRIPGAGLIRDVAAGMVGGLTESLVKFATSFGGGGSWVSKAQSFVRAQAGKPYMWAQAGPTGYDCSGLVSAAWNVAHGRTPYSHTFSTATEADYFPKPGRGLFTAGWAGPGERGGGSVGHTAAEIAGLRFESRGSRGVLVGSDAVPADSFAHIGTYDQGGWLPPKGLGYNGTTQPEAVFTPDQLTALGRGNGPQRALNIYPQRADFTITDLQALLDRQEARDRVGRAD